MFSLEIAVAFGVALICTVLVCIVKNKNVEKIMIAICVFIVFLYAFAGLAYMFKAL